MTDLKILKHPHPLLRKKAVAIPAITPEICRIGNAMLQKVLDLEAWGLAGNQIGFCHRIIVVNLFTELPDDPEFRAIMVNPEITWYSGIIDAHEEGCLSVPFMQGGPISRDDHVKVTYLDLDGNQQEHEARGNLAHCFQHEIDHLDGKLYFDHLSLIKRAQFLKLYDKAQREDRKTDHA